MTPPVIFVLGGPGSGKGTQCERIVAKYGYVHLSSGDLLRAEVEKGSETGKKLKEIMTQGQLVPLEEVLGLIKAAINNHKEAKGFLIDGYPRELNQGPAFEASVAACTIVLYFYVSQEVMKSRLLKRGQTSGRADDNEETIAKRLNTFVKESEPVIEMYRKDGRLREINAERGIEDIFSDVCKAIDKI